MGDPLNRVQSPSVVAQPVSIDPRQSGRQKDTLNKRRRRSPHNTLEETLEDEIERREGETQDKQSHIDYHA